MIAELQIPQCNDRRVEPVGQAMYGEQWAGISIQGDRWLLDRFKKVGPDYVGFDGSSSQKPRLQFFGPDDQLAAAKQALQRNERRRVQVGRVIEGLRLLDKYGAASPLGPYEKIEPGDDYDLLVKVREIVTRQPTAIADDLAPENSAAKVISLVERASTEDVKIQQQFRRGAGRSGAQRLGAVTKLKMLVLAGEITETELRNKVGEGGLKHYSISSMIGIGRTSIPRVIEELFSDPEVVAFFASIQTRQIPTLDK